MNAGSAQSSQNHGSWSPADDKTLMLARSRGQGWGDIRQKHFPTRTPNACRKRWERLMEHRGTVEKDAHRMQRITDEYLEMRKAIWSPLAERMGESWQWVEAQCLSVGLKSIQSSARSHTHRNKRESRRAQQAYEAHIASQTPGDSLFGAQSFILAPPSPDIVLPPTLPVGSSMYSSQPMQPYPPMAGNFVTEPAVVFDGYLNGKSTGRCSGRGKQVDSRVEHSHWGAGPVGEAVSQGGSGESAGWDVATYQGSADSFNRIPR
ncbi:hypothetical protein QBC44DRAFT_249490 [Cladorrhinum sp. PSN332]|nr:hypothetical protein QBC44DRAFT_249490 [Cladorrhinum sp. PSN332]